MSRALGALRILLGAVMVVTALRFFLPSLVPLPLAQWDAPMAVRLMSAFERSGLLAVAHFVHLAAGALLLARRAVPFALAALMPVNVCGLYISLFIEREPVIGILAVATVALNALLMLAYLPSYRGVLEGGQWADGETPEPGRNFESLFAWPAGTAELRTYAAGAVVLAAALAFFWFVVPYANGPTGLVVLAVPAAIFAAGWVRALRAR